MRASAPEACFSGISLEIRPFSATCLAPARIARLALEICRKRLLLAVLFVALPLYAQTGDTQWVLDQSALTYHMSHPMHEVDGTSHAAKGKGICHAGQCEFLIAAPVKSFDSGDTNRDLHMIEATRGAQFPMVVVRTRFPEADTASPTVYADLEIQFAGQTHDYPHVPFQRVAQGNQVHIIGTVPATCSDFKIDRPSFFTVPIKNEIPVRVDMTWRPMVARGSI
jgi:hypothetical protein